MKLICLLSSLLLCACTVGASTNNNATSWPISAQLSQSQCIWASRDFAVKILDSAAQWHATLPNTVPPLKIDWSREVLIALTLGMRPTAGYAIALNSDHFEKQGDNLRLSFRETAPSTHDMVAQVLTQPCIFIVTARASWRELMVRNASNGVELRANRRTN